MGVIEGRRKVLYNKYYGRWYKIKSLEWYEEMKKTRDKGNGDLFSPVKGSELIFNADMRVCCGKYFRVKNVSCDLKEIIFTPDRSFGGRYWSFGLWMVDEVKTKQTFQNTENSYRN